MLTDAWSLKPFLTLSSVVMSVTLGSSLTKNLTFQHTFSTYPYLLLSTSPASLLICCSFIAGLPRVICVTHYTGMSFGSASFTELLCWYGLSALPSLLAGTLSPCVGRQAFRSSSGGKLLVPRECTTMQRRARCCSFYLELTSIADSLVTKELCTPLLYKLLKTDIFHCGWTGSASG